jgi:EAL domain-containing protein (putative c-di-GMP-specific phosphodiesterase class I)
MEPFEIAHVAALHAYNLPFRPNIRMAFQPIIDTQSWQIFAYEALVRGENGEGAGWVLEQVTPENQYSFDQKCRIHAVYTAAQLGMTQKLSINFLPNAVYHPEASIQRTLDAAKKSNFAISNIIFEITEVEKILDIARLRHIIEEYRAQGFMTAIDDFGAGYSGLGLLAELQPDILKIDMSLVRGVDLDPVRRSIIRGIMAVADELNTEVIAEGIETRDEFAALHDTGIHLFQGYYFAHPRLESLSGIETLPMHVKRHPAGHR